jgi:hypothetical protein
MVMTLSRFQTLCGSLGLDARLTPSGGIVVVRDSETQRFVDYLDPGDLIVMNEQAAEEFVTASRIKWLFR